MIIIYLPFYILNTLFYNQKKLFKKKYTYYLNNSYFRFYKYKLINYFKLHINICKN